METVTPERETYRAYAERVGLRITATEKFYAPARDLDFPNAFHFRCQLKLRGKCYTFWYSMGSAHAGKRPELPDVLNSLALDASGYENARDFADFCGEYGYDTDSRKAEDIYRACQRGGDGVRKLLAGIPDAVEKLAELSARL